MTRSSMAVAVLAAALCGTQAQADERLEYIKKLCPAVANGYSLDELYKADGDAKTATPTKNPDGSQELVWGDNLVSKHAMVGNGKVVQYRVKVIRPDREAAEKESLRPVAALGKPRSTKVQGDEPEVASCNLWVEQGYWVRTAVVRGRAVKGGEAYYAETSVINLKAVDELNSRNGPPTAATKPPDTVRHLGSKRLAELVGEVEELSLVEGKSAKIKVAKREDAIVVCDIEDYTFLLGLKDGGKTLVVVFAGDFKTATLEKVNAFNNRTDDHFFRASYNGEGGVSLSGALDVSGGVTPDTVKNFVRRFAKTLSPFLKVVVL